MDQTETAYLIALGTISIWVATVTDTLFVFVVRVWKRYLATRQARAHCVQCVLRRIRRQPRSHRK